MFLFFAWISLAFVQLYLVLNPMITIEPGELTLKPMWHEHGDIDLLVYVSTYKERMWLPSRLKGNAKLIWNTTTKYGTVIINRFLRSHFAKSVPS